MTLRRPVRIRVISPQSGARCECRMQKGELRIDPFTRRVASRILNSQFSRQQTGRSAT